METEIVTKTYEENLLEQESIDGTLKSLDQIIEERISMETIED